MKTRTHLVSATIAGAMIGLVATAIPFTAAAEENPSAGLNATDLSMAAAAEETPFADLTVGFYSKYVWRGYELSKGSMVIQPSMTVGYKGFGFNLWGNLDTDQDETLFGDTGSNWNETDMTISYDGSYGMVGYSAGYIYYALDAADDTQELYGGISLDVITAPTLTVYRDMAKYPGWYLSLDFSHSFDLMEKLALNLGAKVSYLWTDDESTLADPTDPNSSYSAFHDGVISLSLSYTVIENLVISPEAYYSFPLSSDAKDVLKEASADGDDAGFFYGGIAANFSF